MARESICETKNKTTNSNLASLYISYEYKTTCIYKSFEIE
jgi:hypothetical protein